VQNQSSSEPPLATAAPAAPAAPARRAPARAHRGGAWKVAYADFVTALMALFIVLWLMNSSTAVKQSVSGYFRDPRGYTHKLGAGPADSNEGLRVDQRNAGDIRQQIEAALHRMPEFRTLEKNIRMSVTGEGLRIDLLENEQGMFFVTGSASPTAAGEGLLSTLAGEISRMPNRVVVEGHTDARPFRNVAPASGYGNWELATDRANSARRLLHAHGLSPQQVVEVRGFADLIPLNPADANDPRNRRVSLVVRFE
jgi:chemotaxis protein MotB